MRKAIESLYMGICTVTNTKEVINPINKRTTFEDVVVCENEPCRVSYGSRTNMSFNGIQTDTTNNTTQTIKLFISPDVVIPEGSKITVTQCNVTRTYTSSGISMMHTNHQEINLIDEVKA